MKIRRARPVPIAISVATVLVIVTVLWVRHALLMEDVVLLVPEGWADLAGPVEVMTTANEDVLLVRRALDDGETKVDIDPGEWRYYLCDITARDVSQVEASRWEAESGAVTFDSGPDPETYPLVRPAPGRRQHWVGGRVVTLPAGLSCGYRMSPTGHLMAILMADGDGTIGGFWGHSPGGSSAQHYHLPVRMGDPVLVGRRLPIPLVTKMAGRKPRPGRDRTNGIIWSADERFVVHAGLTSLCVVRVNLEGD